MCAIILCQFTFMYNQNKLKKLHLHNKSIKFWYYSVIGAWKIVGDHPIYVVELWSNKITMKILCIYSPLIYKYVTLVRIWKNLKGAILLALTSLRVWLFCSCVVLRVSSVIVVYLYMEILGSGNRCMNIYTRVVNYFLSYVSFKELNFC